jgi:protein tyrosine phosphatase
MTFEPTRVHLGDESDQENIENYINANFIDFVGKKAIATQAPISKFTFYNFWRMIDTYNVNKIFMLSGIMEKNKLKCDRYYPQNVSPESKLTEKEF